MQTKSFISTSNYILSKDVGTPLLSLLQELNKFPYVCQ